MLVILVCLQLAASVARQWFRLRAEHVDAINFSGIVLSKLGILLLNLVPFVALRRIAWVDAVDALSLNHKPIFISHASSCRDQTDRFLSFPVKLILWTDWLSR